MNDIERRRRDLLVADRLLYGFIAARENAKALDSLGDRLSGIDKGAANVAWDEAAKHTKAASLLTLRVADATVEDWERRKQFLGTQIDGLNRSVTRCNIAISILQYHNARTLADVFTDNIPDDFDV